MVKMLTQLRIVQEVFPRETVQTMQHIFFITIKGEKCHWPLFVNRLKQY